MSKKKPAKFSADKAVRAMARERVGQPKASRTIPPRPGGAAQHLQGRGAKHKPRLEELIDPDSRRQ